VAQRQLSTLQELTDPALNSLGAVQFVAELLNRLRSAIQAEGIALIDVAAAAVTANTARTVMIHNDPAAVAEVSASVWPDDMSSLIAVPVVRAGATTAIMEVVNRTGRRATEWEIALVQVVAARIAGFLEGEAHVDAAAKAWASAGSSSGSPFLSGSDLRLTLGDGVSDDRQSARGQQP